MVLKKQLEDEFLYFETEVEYGVLSKTVFPAYCSVVDEIYFKLERVNSYLRSLLGKEFNGVLFFSNTGKSKTTGKEESTEPTSKDDAQSSGKTKTILVVLVVLFCLGFLPAVWRIKKNYKKKTRKFNK